MRESLFVKQNSSKWKSYEQMRSASPDELADRFVDITNDLAYSRTFYPTSKTTAYLNGIASVLHQSIYKNKKAEANLFINFWKSELPVLFHTYRMPLLYAFIFFTISTLIGILSAKYDDSFIRLILGDQYVNMTNENIAKGDPFGVYKNQPEVLMFIQIASNNIYVSLLMFVSGIFFSVGPVFFILRNGVMLGSFEYYFFSKGLGLGHGLLFPKTFTRFQAFRQSAMDASKIALGILPIIIVAAIFESFVTRHTNMPLWLSLFILTGSLLFMIWYVIIYPIQLNARKQIFKQ